LQQRSHRRLLRILARGPLHRCRLPVSGGDLSIPIVRVEIDFRHEILYDARVRVGARVLRIGRTSFTLAGAVFDGQRCAATAQVVAVLFDLAQRRSVEIPADLRQALSAYC
jgi:acyl-CoA thioester hydrolase